MRYIQLHHGSYWFQMRVPRTQRAKHGEVVRVNLQTADRDVARVLGTALAARWLARFSQLDLIPDNHVATTVGEQVLVGTEPVVARNSATGSMSPQGPSEAKELVVDVQGRGPGVEVPEHDRLAALHEYWRSLSPGRPERTVVEFELTAHSFDKVIGVGISRMTRADVSRYRDHLLKQGLQPATVIKRLGHLSAMVQTYVDAGRLERNVALRMRVPRSDTTRTRLPFGDEQLQSVFASPIYTQGRRYKAGGGEAAAWLPPLALATGGRLEELGQLRVRDIQRHRTHGALIHITGDGVITRVKNKGSNRIVPVHPELVRIGFLRYVDAMSRQGQEWLFPELRADRFGHRTGNFTKWWHRHLRDPEGCNVQDGRLVFHSFRHTFKTLCRLAKVPEDVHDALTGHRSVSSVGRGYGVVPVELLVDAMKSIRLPVDLPVIVAE